MVAQTFAPREVVAEVHALAVAGYSSPKIAAKTGVNERTVREWLSSPAIQEEQHREIAQAELRISRRLDNIYEDLLDKIADGREKVSPVGLATMWGISRSKLHERAQRNNPSVNNVQFILVQAQQPSPQSTEQPSVATNQIELTPSYSVTKDSELDRDGD